MAVRLCIESQLSGELEEKLEVAGTLPGSLLRDELWICGDALEDFPGVGAHHARLIYRSNNREPEEPPQNERVNEALLRVYDRASILDL